MKLGVSLGAGGSRGWAHVGVLRALEEKGIQIDLINGASIGAVVGGAYALYRDVELMSALAKKAVSSVNVDFLNIFRHSVDGIPFLSRMLVNAICDLSALRLSLISNKNNSRALKILFGDKEYGETEIPFSSVATDIVERRLVSITEGKLADGILPSVAIPGIFPPVERDGKLLVDGGVLANVPVINLRQMGAEFAIAVRLVDNKEPKCSNGFETICYIDSLKFREINQKEIDSADYVISIDSTEFDTGKFSDYGKAIECGYMEARRCLPELTERIGVFRK